MNQRFDNNFFVENNNNKKVQNFGIASYLRLTLDLGNLVWQSYLLLTLDPSWGSGLTVLHTVDWILEICV